MRKTDQPYKFNPGVIKSKLPTNETTAIATNAVMATDKFGDVGAVLRGRIIETWLTDEDGKAHKHEMTNPLDKHQDRLKLVTNGDKLELTVLDGVSALIPCGIILPGERSELKLEVRGHRVIKEHDDPRNRAMNFFM